MLVICFSCLNAHAAYEDRHGEGWHWYEEVRKQEPARERAKKKTPPQNAEPDQAEPAPEPLARFKKQVEHLKAVAVRDPTFANMKLSEIPHSSPRAGGAAPHGAFQKVKPPLLFVKILGVGWGPSVHCVHPGP